MSAFITFDAVSKRYGDAVVIDGLRLDIARGEFVSLLGPSGSGKTTLLMMLAGFEAPSGGRILVGGERVDHLPAHARNMGVVFQNYALFPHMSVADNIAFPLRMRHLPKAEVRARVARALDMVKLSAAGARRPAQLSGGQQQRIALARALVFEPEVVLMDEPLGALDKQLREHMQLELRELHRSLGLTVVFVTHDQNEAITMSDRIAVFNAGKIEQIDAPARLYARPRTRFVAQFIGETNLMEGTVAAIDGPGASETGERYTTIRLDDGTVLRGTAERAFRQGADIVLSVRPESILIGGARHAADSATNTLDAVVEDIVFQGDHTRVHLRRGGSRLAARWTGDATALSVGQTTHVSFAPQACALVPR